MRKLGVGLIGFLAVVAWAGSQLSAGSHDCVFPGWSVGVYVSGNAAQVGFDPVVTYYWNSVTGRYERLDSADYWEFDNPNPGDVTFVDYPEPPQAGPPMVYRGNHN